jgi:hypothetical protein
MQEQILSKLRIDVQGKRYGFYGIPKSLVMAFKEMPKYFTVKVLQYNANKKENIISGEEIDFMRAKYWVTNFFENFKIVTQQQPKKDKLFYKKNYHSISDWLNEIIEDIDNSEKNQNFDKLFFPIDLINKYNTLDEHFEKNELVERKNKSSSLFHAKVNYWIPLMLEYKLIIISENNEDERKIKYQKNKGKKISDWLKFQLLEEIKELEEKGNDWIFQLQRINQVKKKK